MVSREALGYLLGLIGVIIFAGTLPATRLAVADLDPWFVTFGRAAGAGLAAAVVLLVLRRPWPSRAQVRLMAIAAPNVVITFPLLVGLAMQTVPASHGGVVLGILPLVTAAFGALWHGNRPPARFWLLSMLAGAIVIGYSLRESGHLTWGDGLLFLAALCAALAYVASAEATRTMPGWEVISWICVGSLPLTLPLALWLWPANAVDVSLGSWLGFAYAALFSQFIGFFAWNAGLALGGIAKISQVQYLQTFFTIAMAALVNREAVGLDTVLVATLVVGLLVLGRQALVRG
jgi:drug/metabolite transporter (DMT)-like permease